MGTNWGKKSMKEITVGGLDMLSWSLTQVLQVSH